jgi:hypothetical protein
LSAQARRLRGRRLPRISRCDHSCPTRHLHKDPRGSILGLPRSSPPKSTLPRTGEALLEFSQFYRDNVGKVSENGALRFQGPVYMTNWERTLAALIMFPIGKDKEMNKKMRHAFGTWVQLCADRGWGKYRTPVVFQDAVDPNGILSPGRYGVWPKHLRKG